MTGRRDDVLTAQDLDSAPIDTRIAWTSTDRSVTPAGLIKQAGGKWRRVDAAGNLTGSTLSSSSVASYDFLRRELRLPEGAQR